MVPVKDPVETFYVPGCGHDLLGETVSLGSNDCSHD